MLDFIFMLILKLITVIHQPPIMKSPLVHFAVNNLTELMIDY